MEKIKFDKLSLFQLILLGVLAISLVAIYSLSRSNNWGEINDGEIGYFITAAAVFFTTNKVFKIKYEIKSIISDFLVAVLFLVFFILIDLPLKKLVVSALLVGGLLFLVNSILNWLKNKELEWNYFLGLSFLFSFCIIGINLLAQKILF
jgi:VIT1/CCC1 family predicted Fe2+/Mn2+ transporter